MRKNIHEHYDQLGDGMREAVDNAYRAMTAELADYGLLIAGDDTAERVVDAIARGVLDTIRNRQSVEVQQ